MRVCMVDKVYESVISESGHIYFYDQDGVVVQRIGPYRSQEETEEVAISYLDGLNNGSIELTDQEWIEVLPNENPE